MLVPELTAEGDLQRLVQSGLKLVRQVKIGRALFVRERAGVKTLRARVAQRHVGRLRDRVGDGIGAERRADIHRPATLKFTLHSDAARKIGDVGLDDGKKPVRVDCPHRAVVRRAPEKARTFAVTPRNATEEIGGETRERRFAVEEHALFPRTGIAKAVVGAIHRGLARVERAARRTHSRAGTEITRSKDLCARRIGAEILLARVNGAPARRAVRARIRSHKQRALLAELGAGEGRQLQIAAVAFFRRTVGRIKTPTHIFAQDHVDHARNRIGAVLGRRTVAQHLDPLDGGRGKCVEVHRHRAAADGAVDVHERAAVAALAVHEHEHLVGGQPAQRRRPDVIRAVGQ